MSMFDPLMLAGTGLKVALYGAALFVIGTLAAVAAGVVERDGTRVWLVRAAWGALALIMIAAGRFGLSVVQMGDPGMAAMVWQVQAATTTALLAGAGLTMALLLLNPGWIRTALSAVAACLVAASFALTGHGQALNDPGFVPLIVGGHVLLAGFWVGALWILWPTPFLPDSFVSARAERFGVIAVIAIPALVVGGAVLALRLGGGLGGLWTSTYGQALAVKAAAVIAALGVGASNKLRVTPMLKSRPDVGRPALRRALMADAALFATALLAIASATTLFGPSTD